MARVGNERNRQQGKQAARIAGASLPCCHVARIPHVPRSQSSYPLCVQIREIADRTAVAPQARAETSGVDECRRRRAIVPQSRNNGTTAMADARQ